jgi:4Fe-4S ferredoxin
MTETSANRRVAQPYFDRNRCEGKADCVSVCPWDAIVVTTLPKTERRGLSLLGIIKGHVHGWQQAVLTDPSACRGCRLCENVCPEQAIHFASQGEQ